MPSPMLLVIRRRRPIGEPASLAALPDAGDPPIAHRLSGTAGAGRICHALGELGIPVGEVDQVVVDQDAVPEAIQRIAAVASFDRAVLGSHLVNLPDEPRRQAFLDLAIRQLGDGGTLLVEHHPLDWASTAAPTSPTAGGSPGMTHVRRDPPFVSAVSVYDVGGRVVRQPFTARVLSDDELETALAGSGLVGVRRVSPTWLEASLRRS